MPAVVTVVVEFESDAEAIAFYEALKVDRRVHHGGTIRLSDGRTLEFDHHADELKAIAGREP
jgi:hypothetical protein